MKRPHYRQLLCDGNNWKITLRNNIVLYTIALLILIAALMIIFLDEITSVLQKIGNIRGAKLIIPLVAASWLVVNLDYWLMRGLYGYHECLQTLVQGFTSLLPKYSIFSSIAMVLVLTLVAVVPVFIINALVYRKKRKPYHYYHLTMVLIWLFSVFALLALP